MWKVIAIWMIVITMIWIWILRFGYYGILKDLIEANQVRTCLCQTV